MTPLLRGNINRLLARHDAVTHDLCAVIEHHDGPAQRGRRRPRRHQEPALDAAEDRRIRLTTVLVSDDICAQRLPEQASFILIRTRTLSWEFSDAEMINHNRQQYHCEHGFVWLTSGANINPMFLESPQRIASMGLIYCVGLMTWNLLQRTVRAHLTATNTDLPYHRNKPSANITTRFLFKLLPSVQTLVIDHGNGRREKQALGLEHWQTEACKALGTRPDAFKPVISRPVGNIR